jgi:peroxiredoxin
MVANLSLLTCALLAAQPADRSEWLLLPRLTRGQELVYRGSFTEDTLGSAVRYTRTYRLESRVFVLETPTRGMDVAFLTILKLRPGRAERGDEPEPSSVRLELARVDPQGRVVAATGLPLAISLDGPTTLERGAFIEFPRGRVRLEQTWQETEEGRPARAWRVTGVGVVNGTNCLKLEGLQQSADWDQPRGEGTAWRRRDQVWLAPRWGVAYRVERTLEQREPGSREPTRRAVMRYEMESSIPYPAQLYEERRREILQACAFADQAAPLLPNPAKAGPRALDVILAKIAAHVESHPPTPYRDAVLQVKRRVEAARRGEVPVMLPATEPTPVPAVAALGQRAPDFLATNLLTGRSDRLSHSLGRPVLMVFYSPTSTTVAEVLRFAQAVRDRHHEEVFVLGLSVADDAEQVRKQSAELGLKFPILAGKGLRHTFGVDATPKLLVLDAHGVVRGQQAGWGPETAEAITEVLQRWLGKEEPAKPETAARTRKAAGVPPQRPQNP